MQSDPIGLRGGVNTFGYVLNAPLHYIDPNGLQASIVAVCGGAGPAGWIACGCITVGTAIYVWASTSNSSNDGLSFSTRTNLAKPITRNPTFQKSCQNNSCDTTTKREDDYQRIKPRCDKPPFRYRNDCAALSRQINETQWCINKFNDFDKNWTPNRHSIKILNWENRLRRLKDEHNKRCTN